MATQLEIEGDRRPGGLETCDYLDVEDEQLTLAPQLPCPGCGGILDLHQPDVRRCEAILGSCPDCPAWYLIDMGNGTLVDLHLGEHLHSIENR